MEEITMKLAVSEIVIVAPHCDDEVIGNYEILSNPKYHPVIIYTEDAPNPRREEASKLKEVFPNIKVQLFLRSIPQYLINPNTHFFFPDPIYEFHPAHRLQGCVGEQMLRGGLNVTFYNLNMMAPYCHEVQDPLNKEEVLNLVYPSQKLLWESDKKWILFEGRNTWHLNNTDW